MLYSISIKFLVATLIQIIQFKFNLLWLCQIKFIFLDQFKSDPFFPERDGTRSGMMYRQHMSGNHETFKPSIIKTHQSRIKILCYIDVIS